MNPKPEPPLPGGEYVHQYEPVTPPLPPGVKKVGLIAVGDGGPGPLLPPSRPPKKREPLPAIGEVARLPRWARVAFAARCARRVFPIIRAWAEVPDAEVERLDSILRKAELTPTSVDALAAPAYVAAYAAHATRVAAVLSRAESTARLTSEFTQDDSAYSDLPVVMDTARDAATAILVKSGPEDLRFIRRDFEVLKRRARREKWTDDTPVPPDVFGPLWFDGWSPKWAREPDGPRG